jgi:hypothetical protein
MDGQEYSRESWMLWAIIPNTNFDINNRPRLSHVRIDIQSEEKVRSNQNKTSAITLKGRAVTNVITSLLPDYG